MHDLEIALLDCKLETEIDEATFPVSDDMSEITFDVWIEDAGDEYLLSGSLGEANQHKRQSLHEDRCLVAYVL